MAGKQYIGQNKRIVLDTKRNIFGLTDVVQVLRKDDQTMTINLQEIVDSIQSPISLTLTQQIDKYDTTQTFDTSGTPNPLESVEKNMVFKFEEGGVVEYNVVRDVDTSSGTITFKKRFMHDFSTSQTVTQVGNTGFYEGYWLVQETDLGGLSIGDQVLVDVSSKEQGLLFEGQLIVIEENVKQRFDHVDTVLDEQITLLNEITGGGQQVDVSRILV